MKKLFIVVDYQNDFVTGSLGFPEARLLEEPICRKIRTYQSSDDDVVYTLDTHDNNYLQTTEGRALPIVHCVKNTNGWKLYGKTAELLKDCRRFEKPCFGCLDLVPFLQNHQYGSVELCGLASNICVLSNAVIVKAALPEAAVSVDAECTSCTDSQQNEEALRCMEGLQIRVERKKHEH